MIDVRLNIRNQDWKVHFHCAVSCYHIPQIMDELIRIDCPEDIMNRAEALMATCRLNIGFTYSNPMLRESVVVIALTSSAAEFQNSLQHELRHLIDDISLEDEIWNKEKVGYLTGEINLEIFPYVKELLCECCRKKKQ